MGLMDILNGMQHGPRGPSSPNSSGGGMSPLTMVMLALLAYKAMKSVGGGPNASPVSPGGASPGPGAGMPGGSLGGMLGGLLRGGSGGANPGGMLSGGLGDLLKQFEHGGLGEVANSWVGSGPNKAISANDLENVLGPDRINELTSLSGMSREDLLNGLSQHLPSVIDQLTPNGRVPSEQEAARML